MDSILEEMKEIISYLKSSTDRIDRILASVHLERAQLIFFFFFFSMFDFGWIWEEFYFECCLRFWNGKTLSGVLATLSDSVSLVMFYLTWIWVEFYFEGCLRFWLGKTLPGSRITESHLLYSTVFEILSKLGFWEGKSFSFFSDYYIN